MATSTAPPPTSSPVSAPAWPFTALAFGWLVAAMFATLLLGAAALGMYEAVLIA